jgi:hypothetical protein
MKKTMDIECGRRQTEGGCGLGVVPALASGVKSRVYRVTLDCSRPYTRKSFPKS